MSFCTCFTLASSEIPMESGADVSNLGLYPIFRVKDLLEVAEDEECDGEKDEG